VFIVVDLVGDNVGLDAKVWTLRNERASETTQKAVFERNMPRSRFSDGFSALLKRR
jgi:hypothetical protein